MNIGRLSLLKERRFVAIDANGADGAKGRISSARQYNYLVVLRSNRSLTLPIAPISLVNYDANTRNMSLSHLFTGLAIHNLTCLGLLLQEKIV